MSYTVISATGVSKEYRLGAVSRGYKTLRETLVGGFRRLGERARETSPDRSFWALKDVGFEVRAGEVVGIIGRNGAGKSTLLKILSRITDPTEGRVVIRGRVGSLLEVGTGFHPELTGRENIFMNGAIIGMRKGEIARKFDEIVAFAEVERFIDTAVKHYSSGMYLRLAFAVAANLEPEILFVDEVLAVGDASFQKKCLGKMGEVSKQGRTVLFVSHNMTAVQTLCARAIWLSQGRIERDGPAGNIVGEYLRSSAEASVKQVWDDPSSAPGNDKIRLHSVRVIADDPYHLTVEDSIALEFEYWNLVDGAELNLSLHVHTLEGVCAFNTISPVLRFPRGLVRGVCTIPSGLLNDGGYRVQVMFVQDTSNLLFNHENALIFEVHDVPRPYAWYGKWPGVVRPSLNWEHESMETTAGVQTDREAVANSRQSGW